MHCTPIFHANDKPGLALQGGAHKDLFLGYGSIVGFLIAAHVAALLVWIFLLARSGDRRPAKKIATD